MRLDKVLPHQSNSLHRKQVRMMEEILMGRAEEATKDELKHVLHINRNIIDCTDPAVPGSCKLPQWEHAEACANGIIKREQSCQQLLQGCTSSIQDTGYRTFDRAAGSIGKGTLLLEYADSGTGDFRPPSFQCVCPNGSTITPLKYITHQIIPGKVPMGGYLPHVRCDSQADATTLIVTMGDRISGLEVDLLYTCMHQYDVIVRRSVFRNTASCTTCQAEFTGLKTLGLACSLTLDVETSEGGYWITKLSGSWARERYIEETPLLHGSYSFMSSKGVSSHEHQPFLGRVG